MPGPPGAAERVLLPAHQADPQERAARPAGAAAGTHRCHWVAAEAHHVVFAEGEQCVFEIGEGMGLNCQGLTSCIGCFF